MYIRKIRFSDSVTPNNRTNSNIQNDEESFSDSIVKKDISDMAKEQEIYEIDDLATLSESENVDWNKIYPLIYQDKKINEVICPICKLLIKKEEFIVQCPYCLNLFHGKHLIEWLLKHNKCPICQEIIEIR